MADPTIKIKRSAVEGKIPTADQLPLGEVALNTYDGKLFASKNVGIGTTVFVVNPWTVGTGTNTYNTYFTAGNVGIGTTNATSTLSMVGDANITGVVTANSFSGSGSALTGIVTYITAGSGISINQNTGNVTITATGGGGGGGGTGVTIQDEGSVVGVADSITTLNFVGANVSATASGNISTITVSSSLPDNLVGTALSISGISTFTNGPVLVGSATSTGTSSQPLQVTGGAYVSGNLGVGNTNPTSALTVTGDGNFTGVVTATTFVGNLTGTATTATNLADAANITTGTINDARLPDLITSNINITSGVSTFSTVKATTFEGSLTGNASSATYATTAGIATYATNAGVSTYASSAGIATYATNAGVATALQNSRTFEITGDVVASAITFDGTGNVSLAATIQPNSVALGGDTTGDYVQSITGTANQITVTGGTGEGSSPTLSVPSQFTAPQDVTVTRDLQVNRDLNVNGNITIGGTSATLFSQELKVFDPDIVLGFRTDANNNDVSTDNTANHGGIAIASTEGTPLISLYDVGVGETNPATYKKFMWFKSGTFSGLGTDAWISNYAIGIGSTQVPNGVRLAAGGMQVTDSTLSVPQLRVSGISTLGVTTFTGNVSFGTSAFFGTDDRLILGDSSNLQLYYNSVNSIVSASAGLIVSGSSITYSSDAHSIQNAANTRTFANFGASGAAFYQNNNTKLEITSSGITVTGLTSTSNLSVSGVTTSTGGFVGNLTGTATTATVAQGLTGTPNITVGVVTATSFVKSGGTSSQFLKADGSVDSSTYLTSYTETDTLNSVTGRGNSTVNGISVGILTATSGNFSGIVTSSGANISGIVTASKIGIGTTNATEALTLSGKIQINQNSTSDNRLIFRGQPSSSYRWNIDNYGSSNEFRIFREDDATSANGSVAVSISTTGTVTATKFSGDGSLLTGITAAGSGVVVQNQGSTVGTAGTLNFSTNLTASFSSGTATISLSNNPSISGILTADQVYTSNNGNGTNIRIGDDFWVGDINVANTTRFSGAQDSTKAFVVFGSSDAVALGRTGTGPLYYGGNFNVAGVSSATSFSGSGTNLTGIVTSIVAGTNITVSGSTGQVTINSTATGGGAALDILEVMLFA